ncbi:hypothetical protein [Brevibacillus massiliensis]|uniref:hypothetical protein n=1 Tax=Brevibacillus massiliensis TaxID=1118054 RepID=UPI0021C39A17|nr:hypothetical protein [Brevibacillus massiliensis]
MHQAASSDQEAALLLAAGAAGEENGGMRMMLTAYRGVEYTEAAVVVERQSYLRGERRDFCSGVAAKAVFGSGVYLVSSPEVAAQYAYCHAEVSADQAAVLCQSIRFTRPMYLNEAYGENELRREALVSTFSPKQVESFSGSMSETDWLVWTGEQIRKFLVERGYDGILYRLSDELTYYVCYDPDRQITDISLSLVFTLGCAAQAMPKS